MPRFINADELISKCKTIISDKWNDNTAPVSWAEAYADFIDDIENTPTADVQEVKHGLTDLYIRDKYSGTIHRIGDDPHDMLYVDDKGTIHYQNLQNGDGCIGAMSVNRKTLAEEAPHIDWKERATEYADGYEFVPNLNDDGYPIDPTKEE